MSQNDKAIEAKKTSSGVTIKAIKENLKDTAFESKKRKGDIPTALETEAYKRAVTKHLFDAIRAEQLEVVQYLIEEVGADPCAENDQYQTPVAVATCHRSDKIINYLLHQQALAKEPIAKDEKVVRFLEAAKTGNLLQVIKSIEEEKVDVNATNKFGWTALHWATVREDIDMVKYLVLEVGANPRCVTGSGFKCSELFTQRKLAIQEVLSFLYSMESSTPEKEREALPAVVRNGNLAAVKAHFSISENDFFETLEHAAACGQIEIVRFLVEKSDSNVVHPFLSDNAIAIAANRAAIRGRLEVLKYLYSLGKKGVNAAAVDRFGMTDLHFAAKGNHKETVEWLVEVAGADTNAKDNKGKTPQAYTTDRNIKTYLIMAASKALVTKPKPALLTVEETIVQAENRGDFEEVGKHLARLDKNNKVLMSGLLNCVVRKGRVGKIFSFLMEFGDFTNEEIKSAVFLAAENGRIDILEYFYFDSKKRIDVKSVIDNKDKSTLLHVAASRGYKEMARWLIEKGADLYAKDSRGQSILHIAVIENQEEFVKCLVEDFNIKVDLWDDAGKTPLYWAMKKNYQNLIVYLIGKGADPNVKDEESKALLGHVTRSIKTHEQATVANQSKPKPAQTLPTLEGIVAGASAVTSALTRKDEEGTRTAIAQTREMMKDFSSPASLKEEKKSTKALNDNNTGGKPHKEKEFETKGTVSVSNGARFINDHEKRLPNNEKELDKIDHFKEDKKKWKKRKEFFLEILKLRGEKETQKINEILDGADFEAHFEGIEIDRAKDILEQVGEYLFDEIEKAKAEVKKKEAEKAKKLKKDRNNAVVTKEKTTKTLGQSFIEHMDELLPENMQSCPWFHADMSLWQERRQLFLACKELLQQDESQNRQVALDELFVNKDQIVPRFEIYPIENMLERLGEYLSGEINRLKNIFGRSQNQRTEQNSNNEKMPSNRVPASKPSAKMSYSHFNSFLEEDKRLKPKEKDIRTNEEISRTFKNAVATLNYARPPDKKIEDEYKPKQKIRNMRNDLRDSDYKAVITALVEMTEICYQVLFVDKIEDDEAIGFLKQLFEIAIQLYEKTKKNQALQSLRFDVIGLPDQEYVKHILIYLTGCSLLKENKPLSKLLMKYEAVRDDFNAVVATLRPIWTAQLQSKLDVPEAGNMQTSISTPKPA